MQWIQHRANRIEALSSLHPSWGCEIDLRSSVREPGAIHLSHDPWSEGPSFSDWLTEHRRLGLSGPVILNTKEDGLESRALELVRRFEVPDFFFLDTTVPTLVRWCLREKLDCFAVRVSRHEPIESVAAFRGRARWAWLDCFDGEPLPVELLPTLREHFKLCLVSPELQGFPLASHQARFLELARGCDAICTKEPPRWASSAL
jgi:hypothetical protein